MSENSGQLPRRCPWCGESVESLNVNCAFCGRLPDWTSWVESVHAEAELRVPPGWQGLATFEPLGSKADAAGYLRRELAALRIVGENGRGPFWLEQANQLYANVFRALDALRIADRPEQQPKTNDRDEAERRLAELWRWCAAQGRDAAPESDERGEVRGGDQAAVRLLSVFTDGLADERLGGAASVLKDDNLTVNEKLTKIDKLIPFPPTVSAEKLGHLVGGVSKQAVMKTDWWIKNRKGEKNSEIGRRQDTHRQRAKQHESDRTNNEDE